MAPGASSAVGYVDDDGLIVALYGVAGDATSSDSVNNQGGALIVTAPIELVFWGDQWQTAIGPSTGDIINAVNGILASPYLSELSQYGFQHVSVQGSTIVTAPAPPANYTFDDVGNLVWNLIDDGKFPEPDDDGGRILYMVFMPPGTTPPPNIRGAHGDPSDYDFPADVDYAWVGYVSYGTLDYITDVFSHELAEAITDPEPHGSAWVMNRVINGGNEIGDACNNTVDRLDGILVQAYWSERQKACVIPQGPQPAVASESSGVNAVDRYSNHLDVFWVGQDGAIGTQWWDAAAGQGWGDHTAFAIAPPGSAQPGSAVSAVARYPNHLDVFWVGADGAIGTQWWDAAAGQSWGDHPPFAITPPGAADFDSGIAVVSRRPDHLDVFWVASDGAVVTQWWDAASGQGWGDHTAFAIAPPGSARPGSPVSVVARTANHLDVFWVGADGAIGTQWWDAAAGQSWGDHTAFAITPPGAAGPDGGLAAVARTPNHLDVFWVGADGAIGTQWWDAAAGQGWGDHAPFAITPPGAAHPGSPVSVVARYPNHLDVFWIGADGAIGTQWWDAAAGQSWADHTPFAITPPGASLVPRPVRETSDGGALARYRNHLDVFWAGADGAIGTQWWDAAAGQGWGDHTAFAITPPGSAQPGSAVSAVARYPNHLDVFWVGADGAIGTQWWDAAAGQGWGDHAPFAITPPGAAHPGSPVSVVARYPNHLDVFWIGQDGAIGTQWWDAAAGQSWADHTPFAITPPGAA
ncbi:MAG TPA: hypothetical protein VF070_39365 [Streptosporangiaceae bacterium]